MDIDPPLRTRGNVSVNIAFYTALGRSMEIVCRASGERFADRVSAHDGRPLRASIMQIRDAHVIQTKAPQNGRVDVVNVHRPLHGPQPDFIGRPDHVSLLDSAA